MCLVFAFARWAHIYIYTYKLCIPGDIYAYLANLNIFRHIGNRQDAKGNRPQAIDRRQKTRGKKR